MAHKYLVILINGQIILEAEKMEVDEKGNLNFYQPVDVSDPGDLLLLNRNENPQKFRLVFQANARHWVSWMFSDGPPSIMPATRDMMPNMPRPRG